MALDFLSMLKNSGVGTGLGAGFQTAGGVFGPGGAWELLGKNILSANNLGQPAAGAPSASPPASPADKPKQKASGFAIGTKILRGS